MNGSNKRDFCLVVAFLGLYWVLVLFPFIAWAQQAPEAKKAPEKTTYVPDFLKDTEEHTSTTTQVPTPPIPTPAGSTNTSTSVTVKSRDWTSIEIMISASILVFGFLVILIQTFLMVKLSITWTPQMILRCHGLTIIMTVGALLVTAGYSNDQMAPVMGLLGTVAGYLLSEKS